MNKTCTLVLILLLAFSSLTLLTFKPVNAQPTPYPLLTPSTIALPKNYTMPPLSSLNLKVTLSHHLGPLGGTGGLIYIKGGSGNDINFRVIDPQGKTVIDLGRISNEKAFYIPPDETGDFTIIVDNELSVFSLKEVAVFSASYPDNIFKFAGFSINIWAIILVVISVAVLLTFVVWLNRQRKVESKIENKF